MSKKFVLPISLKELIDEYESGLNTNQLSIKYGCSNVTIAKLLRSGGCDRSYQGRKLILPLSNEEIKDKYLCGSTTYELTKECNCTHATILKRLDKVNCKRRNRADHLTIDLPVDKLKEDYESGMILDDLVIKYGYNKDTIARRLRKTDCEMRDGKLQNNGRWKGGVSFEPYCHKFNNAFKESIRNKFDRTCFLCGITEKEMQLDQTIRGKKRIYKLSVHHVNYDKNCLCDGSNCEFVPLCISCHSKTNNDRVFWESEIMNRIETFI